MKTCPDCDGNGYDMGEFDALLAFVRLGLNRDHGEALAERLSELRTDLASDEDSPELSKHSLLGFVSFLLQNRNVRDPSLVATNNGTLRAEWHRSWSEHFAVELVGIEDARFAIFAEDPSTSGKKMRISGSCSIASVLDQALPHGVGSWVNRH